MSHAAFLPSAPSKRDGRANLPSSSVIIIIYNSAPLKKCCWESDRHPKREGGKEKKIPKAPVAVRSFPSRVCGDDISFRCFKVVTKKKKKKKALL